MRLPHCFVDNMSRMALTLYCIYKGYFPSCTPPSSPSHRSHTAAATLSQGGEDFARVLIFAVKLYWKAMAEAAIGLLASIIAVLQLSSKAVEYLSNAKNAHEERGKLQREILIVAGLLTVLQSKSEEWKYENWSETVKLLESPVQQTRELIEKILPKLQQESGIKKIGKQLIWPFQKGEVIEVVASLERYQQYFLLALHNDHM